jgi:hypothetical protein
MTAIDNNESKYEPLIPIGFSDFDDASLIAAAHDPTRGLGHGHAIVELVNRALLKPDLLDIACKAISSDRRMGIHTYPNGWFGADQIFFSGNRAALRALLHEMNSWDAVEQENMVAHWAGNYRLAELTKKLIAEYGWQPRYKF